MTESEWLVCTEPTLMLDHLGDNASERKLRLFSVACCRRIWNLLGKTYRTAVEVTERAADGLATVPECQRARERSARAVNAGVQRPRSTLQGHATLNAAIAADWAVATLDGRTRPSEAARYVWIAGADAVYYARFPGKVGDAFRRVRDIRSDGDEYVLPEPHWRAELEAQATLLRDQFGSPVRRGRIDPRWLTWNGGTIPRLAQDVYEERQLPEGTLDNARLAVLADALEEAGCADENILGHLRQQGAVHVRGCRVLDTLLGRA